MDPRLLALVDCSSGGVMKLQLDRKADYAVRATLVLARAYGTGRRKVRHIARTMDIPQRYLPQVVSPLISAGIVVTVSGPDGGYELSRPPKDVSLLDVIEAVDGPLEGDRCLLQGGPCDWDEVCPVHDAWLRAHRVLARELGRTTFAELARVDALLEAGTLSVAPGSRHPVRVERRGVRE